MAISKPKQGAYRKLPKGELESLLEREPRFKEPPKGHRHAGEYMINGIPVKLSITAYIYKRLAELEGVIPDSEISTTISHELEELGHDVRRVTRLLPLKYKNLSQVRDKSSHKMKHSVRG